MAGKSIYFTEQELKWIASTMMNQDAFEDEDEATVSASIMKKAFRALEETK